MADDTTGFDSRFDPAFQRGFDGSVAEVRPLATPAAPTPVPDDVERLVALVEAATSTEGGPGGDHDGDRDGARDDDHDDDEPRGVNPFLLALAIVGVVLIGGGIYTAQAVSASYAADDIISSLDYVTFNLVIYGVPVAIALGVATGIGVLFVHAVRWNRGGVTRSRSNSRKNGA